MRDREECERETIMITIQGEMILAVNFAFLSAARCFCG